MPKAKAPKKSLEPRLADLEERANLNFFEIQRHLDNLIRFEDRAKASFLQAEKRLEELEHATAAKVPPKFEQGLHELRSSLEDRIKSVEDIIMLLELELVKTKEKTGLVPGVPTQVDDRLRVVEEKMRAVEKLKIGAPAELAQHEPRLRSLEDNLLSLESRFKQETDRLERVISEKAITEKSAGELASKLHAEIADIRRAIEKAQLLKSEIFAKEKDFAKKSEFEKFTDFTHKEIEALRHLVDRVTAIETSLDRRLIGIEEKLSAEVADHKKSFDTALIKTEEKFSDALKREVGDIRKIEERLNDSVNRETADIRGLIEHAARIEKGLDSRTAGIVSKELAAFSEILDKKFPGLVTRHDFEIFAKEIGQRVATVEAPDISPISQRLADLETRVAELTSFLKAVVGRIPLVVE